MQNWKITKCTHVASKAKMSWRLRSEKSAGTRSVRALTMAKGWYSPRIMESHWCGCRMGSIPKMLFAGGSISACLWCKPSKGHFISFSAGPNPSEARNAPGCSPSPESKGKKAVLMPRLRLWACPHAARWRQPPLREGHMES